MADYGIKYNGVLLQAAVPGAQVIDAEVQPIPIKFTKIDRAAADGNLPVRRRLDQRNITVRVELPLDPAVGAFTANNRLLRLWAESEIEAPIELPDYPGKYLNCVLTGLPKPISLAGWYNPVELVFTAFREPWFWSSTESSGNVQGAFAVQGDFPAWTVIKHRITSNLVNPQWTLAQGYVISLNGTFSSGEIQIDNQRGYVSLNGNSIMDKLNPVSRFYKFPKGAHVIQGPSGGTITWRERWCD